MVEVSRSSLAFDRGKKLRAYARTGTAEVWIVDVIHRRVEVYAGLRGRRYALTRVVSPGESVAPGAFPEDAIPVASFLPPEP